MPIQQHTPSKPMTLWPIAALAMLVISVAACGDTTEVESDGEPLDEASLVGTWKPLAPEGPIIDATHVTIDGGLRTTHHSPRGATEYDLSVRGSKLTSTNYRWCDSSGVCTEDDPAFVIFAGQRTSTAYVDEDTLILDAALRQGEGLELAGTYVLTLVQQEAPSFGGDFAEGNWALTFKEDGTWTATTTYRDQRGTSESEGRGTYQEEEGILTLTQTGENSNLIVDYIWRPGAIGQVGNAYSRDSGEE